MNRHALLDQDCILIDGGMGTMLQQAGLPAGASPDHWNVTNPEAVLAIHRAYVASGAELITANTFGSNASRQKSGAYSPADLVEAGVSLAVRAAREAGHPCFAAVDIGPLGEFLEPLGDLTHEEAVARFRQPVEAGARAGADCILIETMGDISEGLAALEAAHTYGGGLPVFCTFTFDLNGRTMMGQTIEDVAEALQNAGVDALGCNCGLGPDSFLALIKRLRACADKPIIMSPNAGLPVYRDDKTVYDVTPEDFASDMIALRRGGAWGLGGCCGTTPAHIAALCGALKAN